MVVVVAALTARASASPDNRPQDRWFFGISGGAALQMDLDREHKAAFGYETSYWANDYFACGTLLTIMQGDIYDFSGELMAALPLRYIQLYGGAQIGWRTIPYHDVAGRISAFAGANIYASRNLRLFGEVRDIPQLEISALDGGTHEEIVLAGVRWSPDAFHRARGVAKVDYVWWSTVLGFVVWGIATATR